VIQESLSRLLDGEHLTREEARETMHEIMRGEATQAQIAGFLVALRAKGETADEIAGCAEAMREHVLAVHPTRHDLVDTAGTGGDGKHTLNISTRRESASRSTATARRRRRPAPPMYWRPSGSTSSCRRSGSHPRSTTSGSASCSRRRITRR
jgi:anthranilate phosphoribosyltransferase